jgi:hypothetical protein
MARYRRRGERVVLLLTRLEALGLERLALQALPMRPDPLFDDRRERRAGYRAYAALRDGNLKTLDQIERD